jgi:hypothetical protein
MTETRRMMKNYDDDGLQVLLEFRSTGKSHEIGFFLMCVFVAACFVGSLAALF